jgi:hypothetical protein
MTTNEALSLLVLAVRNRIDFFSSRADEPLDVALDDFTATYSDDEVDEKGIGQVESYINRFNAMKVLEREGIVTRSIKGAPNLRYIQFTLTEEGKLMMKAMLL